MTALQRTLGIALGLLLVSAANGWAAGKHKGRSKAPAHNQATPSTGSVEPAVSKSSPTPTETRAGESRTPSARESVRQESRIEFDERMLRGQSAAGVIYLFQRSPSDWKSTVEVPDSFRQRTVEVVTPAEDKK